VTAKRSGVKHPKCPRRHGHSFGPNRLRADVIRRDVPGCTWTAAHYRHFTTWRPASATRRALLYNGVVAVLSPQRSVKFVRNSIEIKLTPRQDSVLTATCNSFVVVSSSLTQFKLNSHKGNINVGKRTSYAYYVFKFIIAANAFSRSRDV